eukprot:scaffold6.g2710.t1
MLSWSPRGFLHHNFLTQEEADHLVKIAKPYMKRSTVVGAKGDNVLDDIRTSYGTFLRRLQDDIVTRIEERVADWTKLNVSHQEDIQVLRYGLGQKYGAHYDSLTDESPRIATVLLFLHDVEEGGETAFPSSNAWIDESLPKRFEAIRPYSACAKGHVAVHPKKGEFWECWGARRGGGGAGPWRDALLFYSLKVDGSHDSASLHTGCPVLKGVKWTATKWIHTQPFRPQWLGSKPKESELVLPEDCRDTDPACEDWAAKGECQKNPAFMRGDSFSMGACRAACGECEVCGDGDIACKNRNRAKGGYLPLDA